MSQKEVLLKAEHFLELGDVETAERLFREYLLDHPHDTKITHQLGEVLQQQGKTKDAIQFFYIALDLNPTNRQYWLSYIEAMIAIKEYQLAKDTLELGRQFGLDIATVNNLSDRLNCLSDIMTKSFSFDEQIESLKDLFSRREFEEAETSACAIVKNFPEHPFAWRVLGILYERKNNLDDAERALRKVISISSNDSEAFFLLGLVDMKKNRFAEAASHFKKAIDIWPENEEAHNNLGNAHRYMGDIEAAIKSYTRAIEIKPEIAEVHFNLATVFQSNGDLTLAIQSYQRALELRPDFSEALYNLGGAYIASGDFESAIEKLQICIQLSPNNANSHYNLGLAFKGNGQPEIALQSFENAIQLNPNFVNSYNALGIVSHELGNPQKAVEVYLKAIAIDPNSPAIYNNMGLALHNIASPHEAIKCYRKAIEVDPRFADAYNNLGLELSRVGQFDEAVTCFKHALSLNPTLIEPYNSLGSAYRDMGNLNEAIAFYENAIKLNPERDMSIIHLLFSVNYHPDLTGEEIYSYYESYEKQFGQPKREFWKPHDNNRDPERRLRIGYVSPSFCLHSCHYFLEPLLANHDKNVVEIYAYAELLNTSDIATAQYQKYADHWIQTNGMTDVKLAERIRNDGIDILVDVAGHTLGNRLKMFAYKPAPISVHWLDFGYTTGLKAIDYYLTDNFTVPAGSEHLFSEDPWRLPVTAYAYRPSGNIGEVSDSPALERGYVTFGTLTRSVRINYRVIRTWVAILKAVPNSRLVINSSNFSEASMQERMANEFVTAGIDRNRLEIGYQTPGWEVLRKIDIGLDCFPHNSGTTLFETLYMGVPFVTISGRPPMGRMGGSILKGVGHPEWIAETESEYVELASKLAEDIHYLAKLRTQLRQEMQNSELMDEVGFTRAVETAYRQMWKDWCLN